MCYPQKYIKLYTLGLHISSVTCYRYSTIEYFILWYKKKNFSNFCNLYVDRLPYGYTHISQGCPWEKSSVIRVMDISVSDSSYDLLGFFDYEGKTMLRLTDFSKKRRTAKLSKIQRG